MSSSTLLSRRERLSAMAYSNKLNSSNSLRRSSNNFPLDDSVSSEDLKASLQRSVSGSLAEESETRSSNTDPLSSQSLQAATDFNSIAKEQLRVMRSSKESDHLKEITMNKLDFPESNIFGRDYEIQRIRSAIEKQLSGKRDAQSDSAESRVLVLIGGRSGTGKSFLAQASIKSLCETKGYLFVTGKFDLQQRAQPYVAFASAAHELVEQVFNRTDNAAKVCEEALCEAINEQGQIILMDALPALAPLFGYHDKEIKRPESQSRLENRANRLHHFARIFFRTMCESCCPIVLLLDNLQWADKPSLELASVLLSDLQNEFLVLAATMRSDEIESNTSLTEELKGWKNDDNKIIRVENIYLDNLRENDIQELVTAALRSSDDTTRPLSGIVFRKTHGNAFFAVQFLQSLCRQEKLVFHFGLMAWTWDTEQIQAMGVTDNVADLVRSRLSTLSRLELFYLQVAAMLGQTFDLSILSSVLNGLSVNDRWMDEQEKESLKQLDESLSLMVKDGLLIRLALNRFVFVHDHIQNEALRLLRKSHEKSLQRDIGTHILSTVPVLPGLDLSLFFLGVDLRNLGSVSSGEQEVSYDLAKQNLDAGQRAMKKAAFSSALGYFEYGIRFLGFRNGWKSHYRLCLDLFCGAAEAAYCNGDFTRMQGHINSVLTNAGPVDDKYRAKVTMILAMGVQKRFSEAIDVGLSILKEMKVADFPKFPTTAELKNEAKKTATVLRSYDRDSIVSLPSIENSRIVFAMSVIDRMMTMAYFISTKLVILMNMRSVQWSVEFGLSRFTPLSFAIYAMAMGSLGDAKARDLYRGIALVLSNHLDAAETNPRTIHTIYCYVNHWTNDMRESLRPLLYGFQLGLEVGDVEMAMYNLGAHDRIAFACGNTPLQELGEEIEEHLSLCQRYKQDASAAFLICLNQLVLNLRNQSPRPAILTGAAMDETKVEEDALATKNSHLMMMLDFLRMQLRFWFGDIKGASEFAERTKDYGIKKSPGHSWAARNHFFRALIAVALARKHRVLKRRKYFQEAEETLQLLKSWKNPNSFHMIKLVQAELSSLKQRRSQQKETAELYKASILMASRRGCMHDRALAHELATSYYLGEGDKYWAKYHFDNAVKEYEGWNADAKVAHLKKMFDKLNRS